MLGLNYYVAALGNAKAKCLNAWIVRILRGDKKKRIEFDLQSSLN